MVFSNGLYLMFLALTTFLVMVQFLHILRYNQTVAILTSTLVKSAPELSMMGLFVFSIIFAYASMGYLNFGPFLERYSTIKMTLITLVSGFMGSFDLDELDKAAGIRGRAYLLSYLLIMIFVLVNFFITMICTFLDAIKNDSSSVPPDHEVIDFIMTTFKQFIRPEDDSNLKENEEADQKTSKN